MSSTEWAQAALQSFDAVVQATEGPLKTDPAPAKDPEAPKLPHERDESVDMTHGEPDAQIQQAYRDVKRGLQDTDQDLRAHRVGHKPARP